MSKALYADIEQATETLKQSGLFKGERVIRSPQRAEIEVASGDSVINFCANNYLGLSDHPDLIAEGQAALTQYGYGMSSVRFICGTQSVHKALEQHLSDFLGKEDTILYSSCFDANTGLFETLLDDKDAIISDALNHASIIDGIRLCKARRLRYKNNDMQDLKHQLQASSDCRHRIIATDGVFSMDGTLARLDEICALADEFNALVMVDDSHAVGFMGATGAGTPEHWGVAERVDLITGTLGKALGGASGGYVAGRQALVTWLRQRSRPYLFSNALAPVVAATSIKALELIRSQPELKRNLHSNATYFRNSLSEAGFTLTPGEHPIIPVMIGDAALAGRMANELLAEGIYVIGFSYPVVPKGEARIRTQLSAAHSREHLDKALTAFSRVGKALNII